MTPSEWEAMSSSSQVSLVPGQSQAESTGAKVLQFPSASAAPTAATGKMVSTIEHLEAAAIENAIAAYKGNLTEAAKALGIGRATLYRKVRLFNIDPNAARRRKAA
jgi:transcriptional regulator of acetoin/glycerol metabolism